MRIYSESMRLELEGHSLYEDGNEVKPTSRKLYEMKDVLVNPEIINDSNRNDETYFMYRAVGVEKNKELFEKHSMRYDVTLIQKYNLGKEFNKTVGHYHPIAEDGLSYPELYEFIEGKGVLLLQKRLGKGFDVKLVHVNGGDKVLVPPNYGHITINTGNGPLLMGNLVNAHFKSEYKPIADMHGGAVYVMTDGSIANNELYSAVSFEEVKKSELAEFTDRERCIYDSFLDSPDSFEYLNRPSLLKLI